VLCAAASAAEKRLITESDLLRFVWIGAPEIAPDGSRIAFVRVNVDEKGTGYQTAIWVADAKSGALRRLTEGPRDTSPRWSPDGKTLAFLRGGEKDGKPQPAQIHLLPLTGGEPHAITSMPKAVESIEWSPDGKTIAFTATTRPSDFEKKKEEERESDVRIINQAVYRSNGSGYNDPTRATHIWTIAVPTGSEEPKPKQITSGDYDERDLAWSPDGSRIYFVSTRVDEPYYDERENDLYAIPAAGGEMVKLNGTESTVSRIAPSPDGNWIAYVGSVPRPVLSYTQPDIFIVDVARALRPASANASEKTPVVRNLTAAYDYDVMTGLTGDQHAPRGSRTQRPLWSADSRTLFITNGVQGTANLVRLDAATGAMTPWTNGKQEIINYGVANGKAFALVSTPTMIGDLFSLDERGTMSRLTNVNEKLWSEITLTEPEELWATSFDGKKIQAWVQKPPQAGASKALPVILNIHGGPHAAYGYTFDHEFQWMAAKGYAVLYPNPRGSTTYGQDFGNIIQYRYPGDDYLDLMACVDALIARGTADPKRLGITGGSGGGVLTNWAITQTDRFAAAVSQRSIADWATFWYTADFTLYQPTWFRKAPFEDPRDFAQRSAITFIDRVKTPLMLIEGEADYRTPPMAGGEMMFRALKYRHIPTVMIRFPDESHELSRSGKPTHRIERLRHIVNWFDKWLLGAKIDLYDRGLRK
jgi:dipeptidyl aminopeptidase/acylaminoacyl peptidase